MTLMIVSTLMKEVEELNSDLTMNIIVFIKMGLLSFIVLN